LFCLLCVIQGSLGDTLKEVRPTAFLGVPRVWEKIQEKMVAVGRSQSTVKRRIAVWAKGVGLKGNERLMNRLVASLLICVVWHELQLDGIRLSLIIIVMT